MLNHLLTNVTDAVINNAFEQYNHNTIYKNYITEIDLSALIDIKHAKIKIDFRYRHYPSESTKTS